MCGQEQCERNVVATTHALNIGIHFLSFFNGKRRFALLPFWIFIELHDATPSLIPYDPYRCLNVGARRVFPALTPPGCAFFISTIKCRRVLLLLRISQIPCQIFRQFQTLISFI